MIRFMTVRAACEEIGVSEYFLRNLIARGECPGMYSGNRFLVNVEKLEEMLSAETSGKK